MATNWNKHHKLEQKQMAHPKATLICGLAKFLRLNGEKILSGNSKFCLTTSVLSVLNNVFDEVLDSDCSSLDLSEKNNQDTFEDTQFLFDFIKKTPCLKLTHNTQTLRGAIDISCFHSLISIELKKIPVHLMVGLNTMSGLKALICQRSIGSLKELLGYHLDAPWPDLIELNISCNSLDGLDMSIKVVPSIQFLDASCNFLKHVDELMVLDNLVVLTLSCNMLKYVPVLSSASSLSLKVLSLRKNNLEDLSGLECFINLEKLDVRGNCLSEADVLKPLRSLRCLKSLLMENNPLSLSKDYHLVSRYFHQDVMKNGIVLDEKTLSSNDIMVSINSIVEDLPNIPEEKNYFSSISGCSGQKEVATPRSRSTDDKKLLKKIKTAVITFPDDCQEENPAVPEKIGNDDSTVLPSHIVTKRIIECRRKTYGSEWLQDLFDNPVTSSPVSSSSQHCDLSDASCTLLLGDEIHPLEDKDFPRSSSVTSDGIAVLDDDSPSYIDPTPQSMMLSNALRLTSSDFYLNVKDDKDEDIIISDSDEENEDRIYIVEKKVKDSYKPLFISIKETMLKEKDFYTAKVTDVIDLTLLYLVKLNELKIGNVLKYQVSLAFDTLMSTKQRRLYLLDDEKSAKLLKSILQPFADAKTFEDTAVGALECLKCSSHFSKQVACRKILKNKPSSFVDVTASSYGSSKELKSDFEEIDICPNCGSSIILQMDTIPREKVGESTTYFTASSSSDFSSMLYSTMKPKTKRDHLSSTPNENFDKTQNMEDSLDVSPILNENQVGELLEAEVNIRRNSGDVTVHNNVSQSSIAVIAGSDCDIPLDAIPERDSLCSPAPISPLFQSDFEEEPYITAYSMVTTSSSSGQVSEKEDEQCVDSLHCLGKPSHIVTDESLRLMQLLSEKEIVGYDRFTDIDHRLKLFLEFSIFGKDEELDACLEADILLSSLEFKGLFIFSSKKIYVMKVVGKIGSDVSKSVKKVYTCQLNELKHIKLLLGDQGFSATCGSDKKFLFLIRDAACCNCFISFITDTLKRRLQGVYMPKFETSNESELEEIRREICAATIRDDNPEVLRYLLVFWCNGLLSPLQFEHVALIITPSNLFVAAVSYKSSNTRRQMGDNVVFNYKLMEQQSISNLIRFQLNKSFMEAKLEFLDDKNHASSWNISTTTKAGIYSLVTSLQSPWESVFGVSFPLYPDQNETGTSDC